MKETFYFSHDYNARHDEKIKQLIRKHGMRGYGIFWALVEDLYNNANALRLDCEGIAFDLREDEKTIESIVKDFGLFIVSGENISSDSIKRRLDERNEKSKKARETALLRWGKKQTDANASNLDANALPTNSDRNAIKERKGKDNKGIIEVDTSNIQPPNSLLFPYQDFTLLSIDQCREVYDQYHLAKKEALCMMNGLTLEQMKIIQDEFDGYAKTKEEQKTVKDYIHFFVSWINKPHAQERIKIVKQPKTERSKLAHYGY